uniref:Uncharacterized protein n=1 Tax=Arundo donax TaxID=35708 RepID=A0A0A8ZZJ1_ARUDO
MALSFSSNELYDGFIGLVPPPSQQNQPECVKGHIIPDPGLRILWCIQSLPGFRRI